MTSLLHFFYLISIITPIITNYFAFYFIIRDYFKKPEILLSRKSKVGLTDSEVQKNTNETFNTKADDLFRL